MRVGPVDATDEKVLILDVDDLTSIRGMVNQYSGTVGRRRSSKPRASVRDHERFEGVRVRLEIRLEKDPLAVGQPSRLLTIRRRRQTQTRPR